MFNNISRWEEKSRFCILHFVPAEIAAAAAAHLKHLTQHLCNPMLSFWKHNFFVLILFIKLSNILAEKINAATSSSFVFSLQQHGTWLVIFLESSTPNRTFISVCRTGRGISCYQLVSGAGDTPGQSPLRLVEPHCRRLPVGLCSAGHLGHLRQGLCPPQGSPRQPARLLPLVRGSALHSSCSLILDTWKFSQAALSSCCIFKNGLVLSA